MTRNSFHQVAWVVDDLQSAMQRWLTTSTVGPFYVISHSQLENLRYRGKPTELDMSAALGQIGPMQIELIQQHNNAPSIYREFLDVGRSGMHHVAYWSEDFDETMARVAAAGYRTAQFGQPAGTSFAYVDGGPAAEFVEVMQLSEMTRGFMDHIRDTAATWDGNEPIRNLG